MSASLTGTTRNSENSWTSVNESSKMVERLCVKIHLQQRDSFYANEKEIHCANEKIIWRKRF
jgi:hypothetical protein